MLLYHLVNIYPISNKNNHFEAICSKMGNMGEFTSHQNE